MTASAKQNVVVSQTLIGTSVTPGATPVMPSPLICAAMVPATCVPWKPSSVRGSGLDATYERARSVSMLETPFRVKSRWVESMPVSRTPTWTLRQPV